MTCRNTSNPFFVRVSASPRLRVSASPRSRLYLSCFVALLLAICCVCQADDDPFDRYKVLSERNIYSKNRAAPSAPPDSAADSAPVTPEQNMVLTGVVRRGAEYVAFFEDRQAKTTARKKAGEALLDGRLEQVTLDYIEYKKDEKAVKVVVGCCLDGNAAEPAKAETSVAAPSTGSAPGPATATSSSIGGSEDPVLQKLRERRQKEMAGK